MHNTRQCCCAVAKCNQFLISVWNANNNGQGENLNSYMHMYILYIQRYAHKCWSSSAAHRGICSNDSQCINTDTGNKTKQHTSYVALFDDEDHYDYLIKYLPIAISILLALGRPSPLGQSLSTCLFLPTLLRVSFEFEFEFEFFCSNI